MMLPRPLDVAVVGNAGVDTNVYFYTDEIDFSVEANFTQNIDYVGQAGGYTARGFAQLGKKTAFIGSVGDDPNGWFVREELNRDGVDTSPIFIDPAGTARSINFMYKDGQRKNFYDGKGHMTLQPDLNICRAVFSRVRLAHFNIPNWARYLLPVAKEQGVTISCDIQDIVNPDDPYRQDFVQYADILFFSAANHPDPTALITRFLTDNPTRIIVVGMGVWGTMLGTATGIRLFDAVCLPEPVIDTNGAGDALAVGFLSSYVLDGFSPEQSIRRGQIAARYACTKKASSSDLITKEKLEYYWLFGI
ncbi:MAG TPA: carbohydrate kinase family protein, partial [Anaerolineales bacterium]|nr:carbohydrate kinase family protein [Anaerolineales bacterium]